MGSSPVIPWGCPTCLDGELVYPHPDSPCPTCIAHQRDKDKAVEKARAEGFKADMEFAAKRVEDAMSDDSIIVVDDWGNLSTNLPALAASLRAHEWIRK